MRGGGGGGGDSGGREEEKEGDEGREEKIGIGERCESGATGEYLC